MRLTTQRMVERRVPLIAHNVLVHRAEGGVVFLELVVSLWGLECRETSRQEGPGIDGLVALLSQALLCFGCERLVIEP